MTITQIAVVVADMESALRSYTENLGWGPWSVFDYKPPLLHDTVVRGEKVEYRMSRGQRQNLSPGSPASP
jgi:methylmalonyl-CoA/ethylmalonyl-CoA epimerase